MGDADGDARCTLTHNGDDGDTRVCHNGPLARSLPPPPPAHGRRRLDDGGTRVGRNGAGLSNGDTRVGSRRTELNDGDTRVGQDLGFDVRDSTRASRWPISNMPGAGEWADVRPLDYVSQCESLFTGCEGPLALGLRPSAGRASGPLSTLGVRSGNGHSR